MRRTIWIALVLSLSVLIQPLAVSAAPYPTRFNGSAQKPAAYTGSMEIKSSQAVFVADFLGDRDTKNTNFNSGTHRNVLQVGTGDVEFPWKEWTLVRFYPIELPSGANITGAKLRLYQQSGGGFAVKVFMLLEPGFIESSVTWNTKPPLGDVQTTANVPTGSGWREFTISASLVRNWVRSPNTNCGLALVPGTDKSGYGVVFASDEVAGYEPRLIITYTTSEGVPQASPPPPPPPEDTTPCTITYSFTPQNPRPGQPVTISATARDNRAVAFIGIFKGSQQVAYRESSQANQTSLTVSYTVPGSEVQAPSIGYLIQADDQSPGAPMQIVNVWIPVAGSGNAPQITIDISTSIPTIPETYRLLKGGGERVTVAITITDSEGIRFVETQMAGGLPVQERPANVTTWRKTLTWDNNNPSLTEFYIRVQATDREGNSSNERQSIAITRPSDTFPYRYRLCIGNPETPELSWDRFVEVFSPGEINSIEGQIWGQSVYDYLFKEIAKNGHCFGISTTTLELYYGRIHRETLQHSNDPIDYDHSWLREYVQDRQGGQIGDEVAEQAVHQYSNYRYGQSHLDTLARIEEDLRNGTPGIISMLECTSRSVSEIKGHAVVPWMSRKMPNGETRVYVYDCNREIAYACPQADHSQQGLQPDFNNFEHFPYLQFRNNDWNFLMASQSNWNDMVHYYTYSQAAGDEGQENHIGPPINNVKILDHDLPTQAAVDILWLIVFGEADAYVENSAGKVTGIHRGKLKVEIPHSAPFIPATGSSFFATHQVYLIPAGDMRVHVIGRGQGEYGLALMQQGSIYRIRGKSTSAGVEDLFKLTRSKKAVDYRLDLIIGQADDNFGIDTAHRFKPPAGSGIAKEVITRQWSLDNVSCGSGGEIGVYVEDGGDSLVVDNNGRGDIEFDASASSTESLEESTSGEQPSALPESSRDGISLGPGQGVTLTPDDWSTSLSNAGLQTIGHRAEKLGEFPIIPILISVVTISILGAIAVTTFVLLRSKKAGKGTQTK